MSIFIIFELLRDTFSCVHVASGQTSSNVMLIPHISQIILRYNVGARFSSPASGKSCGEVIHSRLKPIIQNMFKHVTDLFKQLR